MLVQAQNCIGCENCLPFCTAGAISMNLNTSVAVIDEDLCVECGVCYRNDVCPQGAFEREKLSWPRVVRAHYSDPTAAHPDTGIQGRGTVEMKTNDITGRYREGEVGFGVELGRPGVGTTMRDVEKVAMSVAPLGITWEAQGNPTCYLMENLSTGKLRDDVLNERVLSAILEFKAPSDKLETILSALKEVSLSIDTVFSVSMITKVSEDGRILNVEIVEQLGYSVYSNPKVNVGLGKPLFMF